MILIKTLGRNGLQPVPDRPPLLMRFVKLFCPSSLAKISLSYRAFRVKAFAFMRDLL